MSTEGNLHQGHRRRLLNKIQASPEMLADHELLEGLLFYVLPRIDTNPLAHRLIKTFGGLDKVFSASKTELTAIDGVGEKTAEFLLMIGSVFVRARKPKESADFSTSERIRKELINEFKGQTTESCLIVFLDKNFRKLGQIIFASQKKDKVTIDLNKVVKAMAAFSPTYAVLAHNHILDVCRPSNDDDITTKKLHLLCCIHGVTLVEHLIVNGEAYYSYKTENRLEIIRNQANIEQILKVGGIQDE